MDITVERFEDFRLIQNVAVVGAGNGGKAVAADLALLVEIARRHRYSSALRQRPDHVEVHVLPTGSAARYSSGLTVRSFLRSIHVIEYDRQALGEVGERPDLQLIPLLAEEGLSELRASPRERHLDV